MSGMSPSAPRTRRRVPIILLLALFLAPGNLSAPLVAQSAGDRGSGEDRGTPGSGGNADQGLLVVTPFVAGGTASSASPADPRAPELARAAELAGAVTEILELNLRLAAAQRVERADFIFPHRFPDRATGYYREVGADGAVYGQVELAAGGDLLVRRFLWRPAGEAAAGPGDADPGRGETGDRARTESREYRIPAEAVADEGSLMASAEEIALEAISRLLNTPVQLASLEITNAETLGDFGVYLDGTLLGRNRSRFRVAAGRREMILTRPGTLGETPVERREILLEAGGTTRISLATESAPEAPETGGSGENPQESGPTSDGPDAAAVARTGRLRVTTSPAGAEIFLNDRPVGTTPLERVGVPTGRYEIEVRRPWFRTVSRVLDVEEDAEAVIDIDLEVDQAHPEVAELLVDPVAASLWGSGMTALQLGAVLGSPDLRNFSLSGYRGLDWLLKAALIRPAHWIAATPQEKLIVSGASVGLALLGAAGEAIIRNRSNDPFASSEFQVAAILSMPAAAIYDLGFAPSAGRRRNARTLRRIEETGTLPSRDYRSPQGWSVELGGAGIVRGGYTLEVLDPYIFAGGLIGVALSDLDPAGVAMSALLRLDAYPLGSLTGAVRPVVAPVFTLETDFRGWGVSAGYDFGVTWLLERADLSVGSRALWGIRSGNRGISYYLGLRI